MCWERSEHSSRNVICPSLNCVRTWKIFTFPDKKIWCWHKRRNLINGKETELTVPLFIFFFLSSKSTSALLSPSFHAKVRLGFAQFRFQLSLSLVQRDIDFGQANNTLFLWEEMDHCCFYKGAPIYTLLQWMAILSLSPRGKWQLAGKAFFAVEYGLTLTSQDGRELHVIPFVCICASFRPWEMLTMKT